MMMNFCNRISCSVFLCCCVNLLFAQNSKSNLAYVDPTIGGVGVILEPTRPLAHLPNSMVRMYPQKKDQLDDQIYYFPFSITSHRISSIFALMPFSGKNEQTFWNASHTIASEKIHPHYYQVDFEDTDLGVEFSPAQHLL
jgi:putative alpha-1,2-mannosidase